MTKKPPKTRDIDECVEIDDFYPHCLCAVCGRDIWAHRYDFEHVDPLPEGERKHKARPIHKSHSAITDVQDRKTWERYKEIHQPGIYRVTIGGNKLDLVLKPGDTLKIEQLEKRPFN